MDIYGVATFYGAFSLEPRGKHLVSVLPRQPPVTFAAARRVAEEVERQLGIGSGETTADREFTLETVNCLGACALGPVVVVDGHYFPKTHRRQGQRDLDKAREGLDPSTSRPTAGSSRSR